MVMVKILAAVGVEVLTTPELAEKIWHEFEFSRSNKPMGGEVGGK